MSDYSIILSDDQSDLTVQRIKMSGVYWYYIIAEGVWLKSSGIVVPGAIVVNQEYEEGVIRGDSAAAFRALIKLNQMLAILIEQLHTKTTLFKVKENINAKTEESKTASSGSKSQQSNGPLSQISGLPGS